MKSKELIGKEVIDSEARYMGTIKDMEIDLKRWAVTGVVVKTGFLRSKVVAVSDIDKVGDKVMLKVTLDRVQKP